MPIPVPTAQEKEDEFIARCIPAIVDEYTEDGQAYAICSAAYENATQGGVAMSEDFGRTKFEFEPKHKETMTEYMGRCMSDSVVREKKPYRPTRAGWCYSEYQNRYLSNIGKAWK